MTEITEPSLKRLSWRERRVQEWVAELPAAEPERALAQLAHSVQALNTSAIEPIDRIALLRHYEGPVMNLVAAARRRSESTASLAITVYSELAQGYAMALTPDLRPAMRQRACIGALQSLGELVRCAYRGYAPVPPGLWRRIHRIFQEGGSNPSPLLEDAYKAVLLMGLGDPYALPSGGVDRVAAVIEHFGHMAELSTFHGFAIHPTQDTPAAPLRETEEAGLYLDTTRLLQEINRLRAGLRERRTLPAEFAGTMLPTVADQIFSLLADAWVPGIRRRSLRVRLSGERLVCLGFAALRDVVANPDEVPVHYIDLDSPLTADIEPALSGSLPNVTTWQIQDAGETGLWLTTRGPGLTPPRPGMLIGIKEPGPEGAWQAAVVRWLKRSRPQEYAIGVQVLGAATNAMVLEGITPLPGVRIEPRHKAPPMLLVPPGRLSAGRRVRLQTGGQEVTDLVLARLEQTGGLDRFALATKGPARVNH